MQGPGFVTSKIHAAYQHKEREIQATKKIHMKVIPGKDQRYETCGDYFESKGAIQFRISRMFDWRFHMLVFVHELIEWCLVRHRGIKIATIDAFDIQFEERRKLGLEKGDAEPGDDRKAPYYNEHQFATKVERMLAKQLGVNWQQYDKAVQEA